MSGWYAGIVAAIFCGDFWIKNQVEQHGVEGETQPLFKGKLLLRKHHNRGIMLNAGENCQNLVAVVSVIFTLLVLLFFLLSLGNRGNKILQTGLSLLLGGAFSNTYDRLHRRYVVDYISFGVKWKKLDHVIFNISDFCIIIGALLTALGAGR